MSLASPSLSLLFCKIGMVVVVVAAIVVVVVVYSAPMIWGMNETLWIIIYYVQGTVLSIKELIIEWKNKHKEKQTRLERP